VWFSTTGQLAGWLNTSTETAFAPSPCTAGVRPLPTWMPSLKMLNGAAPPRNSTRVRAMAPLGGLLGSRVALSMRTPCTLNGPPGAAAPAPVPPAAGPAGDTGPRRHGGTL
jgi:hypothetical protein